MTALFVVSFTDQWIEKDDHIPAITGMLVVYCIKDVEVRAFPYGIPELLSIICVILIHIWKRNTVLSIFGGTVIYMAMINMINMI